MRPMATIQPLVFFATAFLAASSPLTGQTMPAAQSRPAVNPIVPPPDFQAAVDRGTRTTTGEPGPHYWQQWANYTIRARLEPEEKRVTGTVQITYFNRSPDTLAVLFLQLYQNVHKEGAIRNRPAEVTGGVTLTSVQAGGRTLQPDVGFRVQNTILAVRPPAPVPPGASVDLAVDWAFVVPQSGLGRMGWSRDNLFHIAYWYPQMAVYDDVVGWQIDPYLGNAEFYAGFGNYDLTIEAPAGWLVMATGRLANRDSVLAAPVLDRLRRAESSDTVVAVVTSQDIQNARVTAGRAGELLTWHYQADSVRDVAFSATSESVWDATRTPVGDRDGDGSPDYARVDAIYRTSAPLWSGTARYAQHAIDFLSRFTGIPYPWPHMSAVEGTGIIGGGMEFPMMTLIGGYNGRPDSALYYVTAHEFAHMWVPMIVSVDERRYAWMDEGTTTFNENQARKEFYPGFDHDEPDRESYVDLALSGHEGEMLRWTDFQYSDAARGVASYSKPASVLAALRGVLGGETFLHAYHTYLTTWAYRHPKPWDFFNAIEHAAGRDLDWFWRSWYYETWILDHSVESVTGNGNGTEIVIRDRGDAVMPVRLAITRQDGTLEFREIGVDPWLEGRRTATVTLTGGSPVVAVELDPDHVFPDVDRSNDVWYRDQ
jgi:Peptidase family M1 domain